MPRTMSLRRFVREMDLTTGDQILISGYSSNRNIHSDMHKLREELKTDLNITQKEFILVDPVNKTAEPCWLITFFEPMEE